MTHHLPEEIPSLLNAWADRPDALSDLREIFGASTERTSPLLTRIRNGDFSWIPSIEVLPAGALPHALGAYARETSTIYLSSECPQDQITGVLLEEIGHHIDTLFNDQETPGDEGALFSAAVRGITLSGEEITAILNEDDSATLLLQGREIAVECMKSVPIQSSAQSATLTAAASTTLPATSHGLIGTGSANITLTGNSGPATSSSSASTAKGATSIKLTSTTGFAIGQTITGSGIPAGTTITAISGSTLTLSAKTTAAIAKGAVLSSLLSWNYLQANSGNSTLIAVSGPVTTMVGGSGNDWLLGGSGTNTEYFKGGSGNSTMVAANGLATLIGGSGNNSLVAGTSPTRTLGQSLIGGRGTNTLLGGKGMDTLRSGSGTNSLLSGSALNGGNTLIGGGSSSTLRAGAGNDSLAAVSGNASLFGGTGKDTLLGGTGTNWLQSGTATSLQGNSLVGGTGSNTLVAGLGKDTIIGGTGNNVLLITSTAQAAAFATDTVRLSTLSSAHNTLGIYNTATPVNLTDSLLAAMATAGVKNLGTVSNLSGPIGNKILLGANAETLGVHTLVGGSGNDTLSVAGYQTSFALLDASRGVSKASLVGGGLGGDTFLGSKGGYDTMIGSAGNDSMVIQASALAGSSFGLLNGNAGSDTLFLSSSATLSGTQFNGISNIENLILGNGNNLVGSLQGSGIQKIVGNSGSDTLSANVYGSVKAATPTGSSTVTLNVSPGTDPTMGFAPGMVVTGNGIAVGTTIANSGVATGITTLSALASNGATILTLSYVPSSYSVGQTITGTGISVGTTIRAIDLINKRITLSTGLASSLSTGSSLTNNTVTLTLSQPTASYVSQGGAITGWLNGATLDGSAGLGIAPTSAETLRASTAFTNAATAITAANYGTPFELSKDTLAISTLRNNPDTYIHRKGDYLTSYGQNNLLIGGQGTGLPDVYVGGNYFIDKSSVLIPGVAFGVAYYTPYSSFSQHQVVDNTLISGAFASNTLIGGSGNNLYLINNLPGSVSPLPTIQNPNTLQSGSTIQFTGNGVRLDDTALSSVSAKAAQKIITANGNNLIAIGQNAAQIGIQTIIGGSGSDTFTTALAKDTANAFDITLSANAASGLPDITVANTTGLVLGALVTGTGIQAGTTITAIDSVTGIVTLSQLLTANISTGTILTGTPLSPYTPSVYFDASKGTGNQSLASGNGNDTLLAGSGNATLIGGDGNNSLMGGTGNNFIHSGIGNSTLDGGLGISTLQADGGSNRFVVRNRFTRILNPDPSNPATGFVPEVGTVDSYINFDPIQSTQVDQFAPNLPDGSPSITKSASFASSDLSSFYNLQNFNLLGPAMYGVGNAMDNSMTAAAQGALMIGMGGNNTLVSSGANSTLIGFVNQSYASPDLYAYAPYDTRTKEFVDAVIGVAGNNYLVEGKIDSLGNISAGGGSAFLDGGPGYNDLLSQGSGSNTLVGTGGNDTFVQRHLSDSIVAAGGGNQLFTSVNLNRLPDHITRATLLVTKQSPNLPNVDPTAAPAVSNSGQSDPANFLSFGNSDPNSGDTNSLTWGSVTVDVANSTAIEVQYGASSGQGYENDGGVTPAGYQPVTVGDLTPDPKNPTSKLQTTLSWSAPADNFGGDVIGYTVKYRASGTTGPWLTYVNGNSRDMTGTAANPSLLVDNLPATDRAGSPITSYDFQVTAEQLTLPTTTDTLTGAVTASPVTLIGSNGNDVFYPFVLNNLTDPYGSILGSTSWYNSVNPLLQNNPIDPLEPGLIPTSAPYSPTHLDTTLFPTYQDGKNGDNLMFANLIGNGDGSDFNVRGVTYSGFHTLVGGFGSDTFAVFNGTRNNFDRVIKYGNETPVDYTNTAPGAPDGIDPSGVSLNGGQHNLIISALREIQLSDTVVDQGKFIDQLLLIDGGQFGMGNRLDNFIYDANSGGNTLVGNTLVGGTGRDSIAAGRDSNASGTSRSGDVLIGGTAYGLDNIVLAIQDYANGQTDSIYRDTDPVPVGVVNNGPGSSSTSQYWTVPGSNGPAYDPLRNSDTLDASNATSCILDGGAGNDLMIGGNGKDTLYVSAASYDSVTGTGRASTSNNSTTSGDVLVGGGGNDWVIFTGSDVYWSGVPGANTAELTFALSNNGDSKKGQSISNVKLQDGDPVALNATGNATSEGNQHNSDLGAESGSNEIVGNEFDNILDGGGVGGTDGTGVGVDTLTGGGGADLFVVDDLDLKTNNPARNYQKSSKDKRADNRTAPDGLSTYSIDNGTNYRTDADYVVVTDFSSESTLQLTGNASDYFIGEAPTSFKQYNIGGGKAINDASTDFGIYAVTKNGPNLVAEIQGLALGGGLTTATVGGTPVDGQNSTFADPDHLGGATSSNGVIGSSNNVTGLNYLGVGAMYNLQGSDFANHVIFA